jgi:REP-associated tyrosine transposase
MPRPLRIQAPGAIYHVTSRGNRRGPIFLDFDDHYFHLWWLNRVAAEQEWEVFGFVHMTNHFHCFVRTPKPNLSDGMRRLNGLYGQVFNLRHGLSGHVFQGRFHSELVESEAHFLECARYDDLNPVRAGLCDHPLEWRWGSFRAVMGLVPKPDCLRFQILDHFGDDLERARQRYLAFVEDRLERAA